MNGGWSEVFLGTIAVATLAMAVVQIGVLVAAGLVARRITRFVDQIERDFKPIVAHLDSISRDTARVASLAAAQVERVDKLFADLSQRLEQLLGVFRFAAPERNGGSLFNAFRAGFQAIREMRMHVRSRHGRSDDDDALFI